MEKNNFEYTTNEIVQAFFIRTINFLNEGKSKEEIVNEFVKIGLDKDNAQLIVDKVIQSIQTEAKKRAGKKNMRIGAIVCIIGSLVTLISFLQANEGETYIIAWGAIIFGFIQFVKGWLQT